ncbi:hypothetical protein IW261DRAFT_1343831 [Armillaria novae-zelandiae]|uniref:Uncharacterized protein n=1 Tax=Armillaria novae-zelandiae TaxID=153914 RepID=A0AA39NUQ1_9AGAR|nr:hypothetical protein IW261DRAFT_1345279 [Armillaria novae-zelandiae]KAK0472194.1 hypothetical protein IW261DRAFT_1343831 [Armillaria novae-zelandiae]
MDPDNDIPSMTITIIFVVLYSVSTIHHVGQGIYYQMWWVFPTICLAAIMEVLGWSRCLWSSYSPSLNNPFQIQYVMNCSFASFRIVTTILALTPLVAANFVILGVSIKRLGPAYSRLTPWILFLHPWPTHHNCIPQDVIALIIQGVGGGTTSAANTLPAANKNGNIMLGGIVFQLVVIMVYVICAAKFLV